jgi:hypothetical protein
MVHWPNEALVDPQDELQPRSVKWSPVVAFFIVMTLVPFSEASKDMDSYCSPEMYIVSPLYADELTTSDRATALFQSLPLPEPDAPGLAQYVAADADAERPVMKETTAVAKIRTRLFIYPFPFFPLKVFISPFEG